MAGLTAPPDNAEPQAGEMIDAGGWFPPVDTAAIAAKIRIGDGSVTPARLREATIAGILAGRDALSQWRAGHLAAGNATLAAVTAETIAGLNLAELLWGRIVMFYAAAELLDGHTDVAATDDAARRPTTSRVRASGVRSSPHTSSGGTTTTGIWSMRPTKCSVDWRLRSPHGCVVNTSPNILLT